MAIKLTKNELRNQQTRLSQFRRYLPTLQLKKAMLQLEVTLVQAEIIRFQEEMSAIRQKAEEFSPFLLEKVSLNLLSYVDVLHVKKRYENIAGVEIPIFDSIVFREADYDLFDTPIWAESSTEILRELVIARENRSIAEEKKRALEKELREVSIRVNLFEKILIPRAEENIKKIRIFLGDQQLTAVAQAKVSKLKMMKKNNDRRFA